MRLKANVIAPLGLEPYDVTDLLLSYMHWDHAGGIGLFPNARVWVQKIDADDVLEIVRRNTEGKTWTRTRRSRRRSMPRRTCARRIG